MRSAHAVRHELRGEQEPRIRSVPPSSSSSGAEAIELARLAGLNLDPWQQFVLTESLGESPDWKCARCTYRSPLRSQCPDHPDTELIHPWAAFEVGLVVARQNGKSEILVARMLAGAFLIGEWLQIYSAHQFDTAMEVFYRLVAVIESTPALLEMVRLNRGKVGTYSHGSEGITLKTGQRIRFKARTSGGGRGFSCDCLMLDEAMILPEAFLGATIPTLSARSNPQIWLAGSAVDQIVHDSGIVLAKRRLRGIAGDDPTLAYFEWSAEGDDPERVPADVLDDPHEWAQANPGLGIRIAGEYIAAEQAAMGTRNFAVERLGIGDWPDTSDESDRVIAYDVWMTCACDDRSKRIVGTKTFGLDVNPARTWGSIAVAGSRNDALWHLAVVAHERGTDWMVGRCVELHDQHPGSVFVIDKRGPAATLIPELQRAGLEVIEADSADYANACGGFFDDVVNRRVRWPVPQPELDAALAAARKAPLGDAWKWSRKHSTSADISPLVAGTFALWGAQSHEPEPERKPLVAFR